MFLTLTSENEIDKRDTSLSGCKIVKPSFTTGKEGTWIVVCETLVIINVLKLINQYSSERKKMD